MAALINHSLWEELFFSDPNPYSVIFSPNIAFLFCFLKRRSHIPRITGFCEFVVPEYTLQDFTAHFRISKDIFQIILDSIRDELVSDDQAGGREQVTPEKQLLMFLWYICNQDSMREISVQFDLSMSTVCSKFKKVNKAIIRRLNQVLAWPTYLEQHEISREFEEVYGIPGVVGLIDGTHIELSGCIDGDQDYINRSRYPSMHLQAVVDSNLLIRNACTGWPGCVHDARVLRNSALYQAAETQQALNNDKFIIGDSAYPLRNWLVTPFQDNGRLTRQQKAFNTKLSSCRQNVERAFGHLKGRMRRLKEVPLHNPREVAELILAACILHNLCILNAGDVEMYIEQDFRPLHPNRHRNIFPNAVNGVQTRMRLMNQLNL